MAGNKSLHTAKAVENNEFYTRYEDIEREMNAYIEYNKNVFKDKIILLPCDDPEWSNFTKYFVANFNRLGLKKLISTSYANDKKPNKKPFQISLFETESPDYDETKTNSNGKIFTLTRKNRNVNKDDLKWKYLSGDGDFRSEEVTKLRDEADIIITNPPFSLFREFVSWILEADKQFIIIGSKNAITYKEIFPLIKDDKLWLGNGFSGGNAFFKIPEEMAKNYANGVYNAETKMVKFRNCGWFTNIDHGLRHEPLQLMTMEDNLKYNKKLKTKLPKDENGKPYYPKYDNYNAIEVPVTDGIPSDYDGVMGVPITFLDKYNPEQFEIVTFRKGEDGEDLVFTRERERESSTVLSYPCTTSIPGMIKNAEGKINGKPTYARITIKRKLNQ